jgi:hypothetical protein
MSRKHKTNNRLIRYLGLVTIAIFGIISTLGSGGGGGDGDTPVTYTGLTTQALITAANAKPLGEATFLGARVGTSIFVANVQSAPQDETRNASVIAIVRALHTVVNTIDATSNLDNIPIGWVETLSLSGNCGGMVSGTLNVNEATETFTSSLDFHDYCLTPTGDPADGLTMDGDVDFDGTCDPATFDVTTQWCDFIDYTMTFTHLNSKAYGKSQTMKGTIATAITSTGYDTTVDSLLLRDDNANVTFKFENYLIQVTENSPTFGTDSMEVSGNAYHPDYGYVVVSTTTPAQFTSDFMSPPESGVILLEGAVGTGGGPTTASFTFTGTNTFTITVDTDGDGTTNDTWSCTWDPDTCVIV